MNNRIIRILVFCMLATGCDSMESYTGTVQLSQGSLVVLLENKTKKTGFVEGYVEIPREVNDNIQQKKSAMQEAWFLNEEDLLLKTSSEEFKPAIVQPVITPNNSRERYFVSFELNEMPSSDQLQLRITNRKPQRDTLIIPLIQYEK